MSFFLMCALALPTRNRIVLVRSLEGSFFDFGSSSVLPRAGLQETFGVGPVVEFKGEDGVLFGSRNFTSWRLTFSLWVGFFFYGGGLLVFNVPTLVKWLFPGSSYSGRVALGFGYSGLVQAQLQYEPILGGFVESLFLSCSKPMGGFLLRLGVSKISVSDCSKILRGCIRRLNTCGRVEWRRS